MVPIVVSTNRGFECPRQFFDGLGRVFCDLMEIHFFRSSSKRFLLLALLGSAVRCQEEQLLFLAVGWRAAACAVKDAVLAFIGTQRRSLTGYARGLSAGFSRKGKVGDQRTL